MAEVFSDDTSAYTFVVRSDHPPLSPNYPTMQMLLESSIFCTQQVTNRQHSGKPQLREVAASLGPFTAAAAQKRERCAQLMEAQLMMEARRQK